MIFARWKLGITVLRPTLWASAWSECRLASLDVKNDTLEVDVVGSKGFASDVVLGLPCISAKVSGSMSSSLIRLQQRSDLCRFPGRSTLVSILHNC